jgi:hypothetical protein
MDMVRFEEGVFRRLPEEKTGQVIEVQFWSPETRFEQSGTARASLHFAIAIDLGDVQMRRA